MQILLILIAFSMFTSANLYCQPQVSWSNYYGSRMEDGFHDAIFDERGNLYLVGETGLNPAGGQDLWLASISSNGDSLWSKTFGGRRGEVGYCLHRGDEELIIGGYVESWGNGSWDYWLLGVDLENGDSLWSCNYGGNQAEMCTKILPATDDIHGYILSGWTSSETFGRSDAWVVKVNSEGDLQWSQNYGGNHVDRMFDACIFEDGYVLCGYTKSQGSGESDIWLLKIDENGEQQWELVWGDESEDRGTCVTVAATGDILVGGFHTIVESNDRQAWIARISTDGDLIEYFEYGDEGNETCEEIFDMEGEQYLFSGTTTGYGAEVEDILLGKTDNRGNLLDYWIIGGNGRDICEGALISRNWGDVDVFVYGHSSSRSGTNYDGYLARFGQIHNSIADKNLKRVNKQFITLKSYPNPFNSSATITYKLTNPSHVVMDVYSLSGQKIDRIHDSYKTTGTHQLILNGENYSSGTYLLKMKTQEFNRKLLVSKIN